MRSLIASLTVFTVAATSSALAQTTPTIDKILERKEIVIGHRPASPPFGFIADNREVTGYSVEICKYVAGYIRTALNRPDLKISFVPVDAANRIPLVQNGTIDLECAATGNTAERQKVVSFSYNILYTGTQIAVRKSASIKSTADLKGMRVAVPAGTVQQKMLDDLDRSKGLGIRPVMAKDAAETFLLMQTGRADGAMHDPLQLAPFIAKAPDPADFMFLPDWEAPPEQIAIMITKGDENFRSLTNAGIKDMMAKGEFEKNYNRWLSVPPYLLPLSATMRAQIANPTDKAIGQ